MSLIIGCPVWHRDWIIEEWIDHAVLSAKYADITPTFLVVTDPRDPTCEKMVTICEQRRLNLKQIYVEENRAATDKRQWTYERFAHMVYLRNKLLKGVRRLKPDYFLSLDSDILLAPPTIEQLIESQQEHQWDAVGGKCYMTTRGRQVPSYALFKRNSSSLRRQDSNMVMRVHVIMAIKLMTPAAYNIDYAMDRHGEDIGWSMVARANGLKLGWDGRTINKHVMHSQMLGAVDERVGF